MNCLRGRAETCWKVSAFVTIGALYTVGCETTYWLLCALPEPQYKAKPPARRSLSAWGRKRSRLGEPGQPWRGEAKCGRVSRMDEGTHKGCPYGGCREVRRGWRVRGHPQGVPLRLGWLAETSMSPKPCSVYVLCAVCLGGMGRQYFCSGLSMVIAVNVGHIWEWPRLSCVRWHMLGMRQDAGGSPAAARRQLHISHTLLRREHGRGRCGGGAPAQGRAE